MKKQIWGGFNLHELAGKDLETPYDKTEGRGQGNGFGAEPLLPVPPVAKKDGGDVVFINGETGLQNGGKVFFILIMLYDGDLDLQWDLRIGDNRGKKQCMGTAAFRASDTAYTQTERLVPRLDCAHVGAMPDKAGTASTGTFQLMKGKGIYGLIIKILGKGVV